MANLRRTARRRRPARGLASADRRESTARTRPPAAGKLDGAARILYYILLRLLFCASMFYSRHHGFAPRNFRQPLSRSVVFAGLLQRYRRRAVVRRSSRVSPRFAVVGSQSGVCGPRPLAAEKNRTLTASAVDFLL